VQGMRIYTPIPFIIGLLLAAILWPMPMARAVNYADHVVINEFELNPPGDDAGKQFVELFNPTSSPVDVDGWTVRSQNSGCQMQWASASGHIMLIPGETFLAVALIKGPGGAPCLSVPNDAIALLDKAGIQVDKTPTKSDSANDAKSWQRMPDGATDIWEFKEATKGIQNDPNTTPVPEFSEILPVFIVILVASSSLVLAARRKDCKSSNCERHSEGLR